ncbi:MAG: ATP-grasp domain-containing protein [archaeon]
MEFREIEYIPKKNYKASLKIAVAFNLKKEAPVGMPEDYYAEYDSLNVPEAIRDALIKKGHTAELVEANQNFFDKIKAGNFDFVFNIAEGINQGARESQVPAILDMLGIPYTGSGVLTQAITLDKTRTKEILLYHGIPTPKYQLFTSWNQKINPNLIYPLIVKPNAEGSSKGIRNNSIVSSEQELRKMLRFVQFTYGQSALVEEFLDGREFTVSMIGNNPSRVLPIVEISFDDLPEGLNKLDSYEVKWIWDNPNNPIDSIICPAKITKQMEWKIKQVAQKTFEVLDIKDLCRIDMRLDSFGLPNVIEVNALPGLMPDPLENSRFPKSCYSAGMTYEELVNTVLLEAMERYGLIKKVAPQIKNASKMKI